MKLLKIAFKGTAYVCSTLFFIAGIILIYENFFMMMWEKADGIGTMLFSIAFYLLMTLMCTIAYIIANALINMKNFFGKFLDQTLFKDLNNE